MILVIRIQGSAELNTPIEETLNRLNIHRKFATTFIDEKNEVLMGMLEKIKNYVCFYEIDENTAKQIILKRGQTKMGKKINEKDVDKIWENIKKGEWTIKKFFRLHPPIGGFRKNTKLIYPKGILGKNKDITKLVLRML